MIKICTTIILCLTFTFISLAQVPDSPIPNQNKVLGSSLEQYKNRAKDSQNNRKKDELDDAEILQVKTDLVMNDVLVTNQYGNFVTGLTKDDFMVTEDGVPETIETFSFGENSASPRSIVLILDTGVTMLPYLKSSLSATKILVDKLGPKDRMAIVTDKLNLLTDFTQNKALLKNKLDSFKIPKSSELSIGFEFTNLLAVLNEMFAAEDINRIIISQGSGNGIFWIKTDDERLAQTYKSKLESMGVRGNWKKEIEFKDITKAIEKSRTTIYSIIPGMRILGLSRKEQLSRSKISSEYIIQAFHTLRGNPMSSYQIPYSLLELTTKRQVMVQTAMSGTAELSGGYTGFIEKPEDAENVYADIFKRIDNRYLIGYYPVNQEQDKKPRSVKIEVRKHPDYTVTYRKFYNRSDL